MTQQWKNIATDYTGFNDSTDVILGAIQRHLTFDKSLTRITDIDTSYDEELIRSIADRATIFYHDNLDRFNHLYKYRSMGMRSEAIRAYLSGYTMESIADFDTNEFNDWITDKLHQNSKASHRSLPNKELRKIITDSIHKIINTYISLNDERQLWLIEVLIVLNNNGIIALDRSTLILQLLVDNTIVLKLYEDRFQQYDEYTFKEELYKLFLPKVNIVKATCQELGLTYKELGEAISVKESTLNKIASTGVVSDQIQKAISLYLETIELKEQLKDCDILKQVLKNLIK